MCSLNPLFNDLTVQTSVAAAAVVQSEIVQGRRFSLLHYLMRSEIDDTITIESKIKLFMETILPRLSCESFFNENGVITDSWQRTMQLSGFKITPFCDEAVFPPEHIFNIIQYMDKINLISCTSDFKPVLSFLNSISCLLEGTFSKEPVSDAVGVIMSGTSWLLRLVEVTWGLQKIRIAIDAGSTLKKVYIIVDSEKQQKEVQDEIDKEYEDLNLTIQYVLAEKHSMSSEKDGMQLLHLIKDELVGQQILLTHSDIQKSDVQKSILEILDGKNVELLSSSRDIKKFVTETLSPIQQYLTEGVEAYEKANPSIALRRVLTKPTGDCFVIATKILELLNAVPLENIDPQHIEKFKLQMKELGARNRNKFYAPVGDCIGDLLMKKRSIDSIQPFFTEMLTAGLIDWIKKSGTVDKTLLREEFTYFISHGADLSKVSAQDLNNFKEIMERRSRTDADPRNGDGMHDATYHKMINVVFTACRKNYP